MTKNSKLSTLDRERIDHINDMMGRVICNEPDLSLPPIDELERLTKALIERFESSVNNLISLRQASSSGPVILDAQAVWGGTPAKHRGVVKPFDRLSLNELHEIMRLRNEVFVVGQKITCEPEVDGLDPECEHAMLYEGEVLVGTARIFAQRDPIVVGRVAVCTDRQRGGLGSILMRAVQEHLGQRAATLHAQAHLEAWYARLGWRRVGDVFFEAEIPHVTMVRGLESG